jgi:hypothetical protein
MPPIPTPHFTWLSGGPQQQGQALRLPFLGRQGVQSHTCRGSLSWLPKESESHLGPTTSCSGGGRRAKAGPSAQLSSAQLSSVQLLAFGVWAPLPATSLPQEWGELLGRAPSFNDFMEI